MMEVFINDKPLYIGKDIAEGGDLFPFELKSEGALSILFEVLKDTRVKGAIWQAIDEEEALTRLKIYAQYIQAAGGLVFKESNLLAIYRLGKWDLPKGKQESGESIEITARREVEEECALSSLTDQQYLGSSWHMYEDKYNDGIACIKRTFWYRFTLSGTENPTAQSEEQIEECRWFKPEEKNILLKGTYASLKNLIRTNF